MTGERLLVIEDNPNVAELVGRVAEEMAFGVQCVTGQEFKEIYTTFQPDIIVMDILMPEVDGVQVLQHIHEHRLFKSPRIVLLSGSPATYRRIVSDLGMAFGLCMEANLAKPFRIHELREVLERARASLGDANWPREESA